MKNNLFTGRKIVIATKHKKEDVIAPLLERHLDVQVVIPENFNSDKFGTFTREIKRVGNQLEAARIKAITAMELTGTNLAVASEGSFGEHPSMPFMQSNLELVLLIDKKNNYEIRGHHRTFETNLDGTYVSSIEEVLELAKKHNFPEHGLILRRSEKSRFGVYKEIKTLEELILRAKKMLSSPFLKRIFVETDMRAHRNPTRMKAIEKATEDLIKNIRSSCPQCGSPGFVVTGFKKGLLCRLCKLPTDLPQKEIYLCGKCGFSLEKPATKYGKLADPKDCDHCNP